MQPRHLPPWRQRIGVQDLFPIQPGGGRVLAGHKKIRNLHGLGNLEDQTEIVVRVTGSLEVLDLGIRNPGRVGFAYALVLVLFPSNPLAAPFSSIQQPSLPPACVTSRIRLSILVPNLDAPKVTLLGNQCRTSVAYPCRLLRFDSAASPTIRFPHAESCGARGHLDRLSR